MFEAINIVAVLGTTFVMMAVGTIWYSPMLFGGPWMRSLGLTDADVQNARPKMVQHVLTTFGAYAIMLFLLAHLVALTPRLGVEPYLAGVYLTLFVLAFFAAMVVWENRSWTYYLINAGFQCIFIIGGSVVIDLWPW